jgi:hypothetical protein
MVKIRITATIENEYANRLPDFLPLDKLNVGVCDLTREEAQAVLADAKYNSDRQAVDVGPYGTPLPVFNAYRALAAQVEKALVPIGGCKDGGTCHHACVVGSGCFREACCVPLSASGLDDNWKPKKAAKAQAA